MNQYNEMGCSNVDEQEIAKFAAMAAHWWAPEGECKPLHRINPLRLDWITRYSDGIFGKNVIDIGCGGGILTESMAREGANVTGLDMSQEALQVARLHAREHQQNIQYIYQTVEAHVDHYPASYDVVTCMEMLEHVPDPHAVVRACARLVKPGGDLFFSTINRNPVAWLFAIVGAEYLLQLVPRGTHDIRKCIRPAELLSWLDDMPQHHITGLHYNPVTQQFRLGPGVTVNYIVHARRAA